MKYAVFWDVTSCGCCKNRRFGELLLVTANNVVHSSPILLTLMMDAVCSQKTAFFSVPISM
jgi:hypothetical protein